MGSRGEVAGGSDAVFEVHHGRAEAEGVHGEPRRSGVRMAAVRGLGSSKRLRRVVQIIYFTLALSAVQRARAYEAARKNSGRRARRPLPPPRFAGVPPLGDVREVRLDVSIAPIPAFRRTTG